MEKEICQSCSMPLTRSDDFGTNADGSRNEEYCQYCYKNGEFSDPNLTKEQMIEKLTEMSFDMGMTEQEARDMAEVIIPTLKRWQ